MDSQFIIETENLCYGYDEKKALDSVNFRAVKGEITAVIGPNGAGKSTLFLNLNGVLKPDSGEVYYLGEKIKYDSKGIRKLREKVGIVFQDPNDQIFSDSVRNDIAFGAINMGIDKHEIPRLTEEVSRQTGIYELLDKPVHALSFGQKKRVAIAGVLIMKPELIILDEPTAGLDPSGVSEILKLLTKIKDELGMSVIISTHEIDLVPLYCGYTYVMKDGKIAAGGETDKIMTDASLLRGCGLRTPRIMHLMEILNKEDHIEVDTCAATISAARKTIREQVM